MQTPKEYRIRLGTVNLDAIRMGRLLPGLDLIANFLKHSTNKLRLPPFGSATHCVFSFRRPV